ncbi:hypothetical protein V500_07623 [Pseudogymnoascus sp. VKM F-4518 (FW-2643)]|nr:hypothetical protein V500_07623 [Pseudogymnoascus sp. VKM F-4518 (FW-2643)]
MKILFTFLAFMAALSSAHVELTSPAAFRSKYNQNIPTSDVDYDMTSPLHATGSDYPCKGYLSDLGTLAGGSVKEYVTGFDIWFNLAGTATHGGGSCQASLSIDGGTTFKVITSYIGNCPIQSMSQYAKVPNDVPAGPAVFAWTWFNKLGNREMYMNCASITIRKGLNNTAPSVPFASLPDIFVANIGNDCSTAESFNVEFPDPGNDVQRYGVDGVDSTPPIGLCAPISGRIGSSSSSSLNDATSQRSTATTTSIEPSQTDVISKTSPNGTCNSLHTCIGSDFGQCCSKYGYCGATEEYCGDGCNPSFGRCSEPISSSSSSVSTDTGTQYVTRTQYATTKKTTTISYTKPASTCTY